MHRHLATLLPLHLPLIYTITFTTQNNNIHHYHLTHGVSSPDASIKAYSDENKV